MFEFLFLSNKDVISGIILFFLLYFLFREDISREFERGKFVLVNSLCFIVELYRVKYDFF